MVVAMFFEFAVLARAVFVHRKRLHVHFFGLLVIMLFVFGLVAVDLGLPLLERVVVEGITQAEVRSAPVGETAVVPVLLVGSDWCAKRVQLIHIRVEVRTQVDGVVYFRDFDTQVDVKQAPVHRVGNEVIASRNLKLVDQTHHLKRLLSRRVVAVDDLHLQVVVHREIQHRRLAAHGIAIDAVREARIDLVNIHRVSFTVHLLYLLAVLVQFVGIDRLVITAIVAPELFLEVRVVTK